MTSLTGILPQANSHTNIESDPLCVSLQEALLGLLVLGLDSRSFIDVATGAAVVEELDVFM